MPSSLPPSGAPEPGAALSTTAGGSPHLAESSPRAAAPPWSAAHTPARAAFERMDSASLPQVLAANPQRLEVGVRDAALGWVEIRTHGMAGHISAVVSAASNEAHAALSAQLPAMREYLANQHLGVERLRSETFSSSPGSGQGSSGGGQSHPRAPGQPSSPSAPGMEAEDENLSYISVRV